MTQKKTILLICDCYGLLTSGGRLIRDLEVEILNQGISVKALHQTSPKRNIVKNGNSTKKVVSNLRRGIDEILLAIRLSFQVLLMPNSDYIGVISYSPSVFLFLPALIAKLKFRIKYYLITRDVLPQWLLQTGVMNDGLVYKLLLYVSRMSYSSASFIGLQSNTDKDIVDKISGKSSISEVLDNWRTIEYFKCCAENVHNSDGVRILYAGNVGEAQKLDFVFKHLLNLNQSLRLEIIVYGFGRGLESLKTTLSDHPYSEMISFYEPVTEKELYKIASKCDCGLVALDDGLLTGNIPGKILTYLNYRLPVIGVARQASELESLIKQEHIGIFLSYECLRSNDTNNIAKKIIETNKTVDRDTLINCLKAKFSTEVAVKKILSKLTK